MDLAKSGGWILDDCWHSETTEREKKRDANTNENKHTGRENNIVTAIQHIQVICYKSYCQRLTIGVY